MDSNLAILLAAFIGAISGLAGTLLAHIVTQKKEKRQMLRNKAEELHELINKTSNFVHMYDTSSNYQDVSEILDKIRPDRARLIIDFYFPQLRKMYDNFIDDMPRSIKLSEVGKEDWKQAMTKFDLSANKLHDALKKSFREEKLDR